MGRGVDGLIASHLDCTPGSARRRARGRLELQAAAWDSGSACAQQKIVQNEPNCSQLAKWSGALRICALWRAARAGPKIRRMQNFFELGFSATTDARGLRGRV